MVQPNLRVAPVWLAFWFPARCDLRLSLGWETIAYSRSPIRTCGIAAITCTRNQDTKCAKIECHKPRQRRPARKGSNRRLLHGLEIVSRGTME